LISEEKLNLLCIDMSLPGKKKGCGQELSLEETQVLYSDIPNSMGQPFLRRLQCAGAQEFPNIL
jgi:hypothetical protein